MKHLLLLTLCVLSAAAAARPLTEEEMANILNDKFYGVNNCAQAITAQSGIGVEHTSLACSCMIEWGLEKKSYEEWTAAMATHDGVFFYEISRDGFAACRKSYPNLFPPFKD